MAINLTKDSIDLGIVTTQPEKMLMFYRDVLGFEMKGEMPLPKGGRMYRLLCGTSMVKIVVNGHPPGRQLRIRRHSCCDRLPLFHQNRFEPSGLR